MTIALTVCASCGSPFAKVRTAQRACSPACKKALFRAEKRDTGHPTSDEVSTGLERAPTQALDGEMTRIWGPNRLSKIELHMLGLEPTGLTAKGGAHLYRRTA